MECGVDAKDAARVFTDRYASFANPAKRIEAESIPSIFDWRIQWLKQARQKF